MHETFRTQRIEHAFLEPESTLAVPSGEGDERTLHVYSGGQGVWDDRNDIAAVLGLDRDRVTVELVSNGGAFGGKEDMANQAQTALAAWLLDRPVKCTLSREESLLIHPKRHPITLEYWAGCDAEGRLTGSARARHRRLGRLRQRRHEGARARRRARLRPVPRGRRSTSRRSPCAPTTSCAGRSEGSAPTRPSSRWRACSTGSPSRSASRAWEIRKRNVIRPGDTWGPGQVMDDGAGGAEVCLDEIRADYEAAIAAGKAVGLGLGLKNSGLGNGFREVSGARGAVPVGRRPGRGPPRLDRDGPGRAHRGAAGGGRRSSASSRPGST